MSMLLGLPGSTEGAGLVRTLVKVLIVVAILAIIIGLPIRSGYSPLPLSGSPSDVGSFLGGIARYWVDVFRAILARF